jgi:3'(2'), 5'-bisphosphate nucleotidase
MYGIPLLLPSLAMLAQQAGEAILDVYHDKPTIRVKSDLTPVTNADLIAHKIITEGLKNLTPEIPVLSEEGSNIAFEERAQWLRYWLIDPLDGTQEFIEKKDEFTVNIALVENHQPIIGVVLAPALETTFFASKGMGAFKQVQGQSPQKIHASIFSEKNIRIIVSRRHGLKQLEDFLKQFDIFTKVHCGSALKFCLLAEGAADIYPRLSPTSEWDTAAGQCVLEQAGGVVVNSEGEPLRYNTKNSLENPCFIAVGDKSKTWGF